MLTRPAVALVLALALLAGCGDDGGDESTPVPDPAGGDDASADTTPDGGQSGDSGNGGAGNGNDAGGDSSGVTGIDLSSLGPSPAADPQTAVIAIDGETLTFDIAELGAARCEVAADAIAVNIGQSEDWLAFVATPAGNSWSAGPTFGIEDGLQYEALTPGSEIVVEGDQVTFRGEIVVKTDPIDPGSWVRTLGGLTVNCAAS